MRENYARSLAVTLDYEGGWSDHPADKGGPTMKGVTIATMRRFFPGATLDQLRTITAEQLQTIYRHYWSDVRGDTLAAGVDLVTFDYGVNSGPGTALKQLTKVLGGSAVDTVKKLCAKRLSSYRSFANWKQFGRGWAARIARVEAKGIAWAAAAANLNVKDVLDKEQVAATKAQTKSATGAGAAGTAGAGTAAAPAVTDQAHHIGGLALGAILAVLAVILVLFLVRAHVQGQRAKALKAEKEA